MKMRMTALAIAAVFGLAATVQAETKVTVKNVHICCPQCVKIIGTAVKEAGATPKCDQKAKTVTITGADDATVQKGLDALVKAGFHGTTDSDKLTIKDDSGAGKEKVKRIELEGVHNCCGVCCKAIKEIVTKVSGVEATNVKPKSESFAVEGDFSPADVVKALNENGFHAKVKKD
jgi:copper chaperone CopZ